MFFNFTVDKSKIFWMKIAALLFIFIPFLSFSQKPNKNDVPTTSLDSIVYDLTPKTLAPSSIVLPFKSIVILDARFDTSKLGYEVHKKYEKIMYSDFKKIKLSRSIQESVQFFYNDYYNLCLRDSAYKLLIVLKTLWIDNAPRPEFAEENYHEYLTESYQDIYVRWEYYLQKKDNYYPLKKTDTTYRLSQTALALKEYKFKKNDLSFFTFVLKAEIEKINFNDFAGRIENIKAISFQTIDSFNKKRYLLPVLNSKNIQTGVFQNFEEFKNNTPQIKGYKLIKKDKGLYWVLSCRNRASSFPASTCAKDAPHRS